MITCSDLNCIHNVAGICQATDINHTSDRFCTTGRRKTPDNTQELMQTFKAGCRSTKRGYKAVSGMVIK